MKKASSAIALLLAASCIPAPALAQGGNRTVPAGDALEQTPPVDVTGQELRAAPPEDRTPEKLRELQREPGVVPSRP